MWISENRPNRISLFIAAAAGLALGAAQIGNQSAFMPSRNYMPRGKQRRGPRAAWTPVHPYTPKFSRGTMTDEEIRASAEHDRRCRRGTRARFRR